MKPTTDLEQLTNALMARFPDTDAALTAAIDLAVLVANADGRIDKAEMTALAATIDRLVGARLAPAVSKHLVTESRTKIRELGAGARAREVGATLREHGAGVEGLRVAFAIAVTSEGISAEERALVDALAEAAGVGADQVEALAGELA